MTSESDFISLLKYIKRNPNTPFGVAANPSNHPTLSLNSEQIKLAYQTLEEQQYIRNSNETWEITDKGRKRIKKYSWNIKRLNEKYPTWFQLGFALLAAGLSLLTGILIQQLRNKEFEQRLEKLERKTKATDHLYLPEDSTSVNVKGFSEHDSIK